MTLTANVNLNAKVLVRRTMVSSTATTGCSALFGSFGPRRNVVAPFAVHESLEQQWLEQAGQFEQSHWCRLDTTC